MVSLFSKLGGFTFGRLKIFFLLSEPGPGKYGEKGGHFPGDPRSILPGEKQRFLVFPPHRREEKVGIVNILGDIKKRGVT